MIDQSDLTYFVEIARAQNVSRAAERLGLSQPALSHCMKRLENALDCELFLRSKKGITLTSSGERLLEHAEKIISDWQMLKSAVKNETNQAQGQIRLGIHTAVAQYALPPFLSKFLQTYSEIEVSVHHGLSRHISESVVSKKLDVGIVVNPVENPDLIIRPMCTDEVAVWKSKDCKNLDVLILEPDLVQTQEIVSKLKKQKIEFKRKLTSSSLEVIANLIVSGAGIGIAPTRVMRSVHSDSLHRIKDAPTFQDKICLVFRPEFRKLARGKAFIESVSQIKF